MNFLYIGYWNLSDPLTSATIYPSLRALHELQPNGKIVFVNIQREQLPAALPDIFKELEIIYSPIISGDGITNKVRDFWQGPAILESICKAHQLSKVIARGAPAGALAYLLWKRIKIPFFVESFEPHADYMLESKVWTKYDIRYILQSHWENKQKKYAVGLMPVSTNYQNRLIEELVKPEKIKVVPCAVSERQFNFNQYERLKLRTEFGIGQEAVVGLYVGKYDGLYLGEESFRIYRIFFDQLPGFNLIILSSTEYHLWIYSQIKKYKLPAERIYVKSVIHSEVSNYCSASDFGFVTIKPYESGKYCSPVKIGEYWVSGLPIFMTRGVGDESSMIQKGFGGVLFEANCINSDSLDEKIENLMCLVKTKDIRETISRVGIPLRSFEKIKLAYNYFLLEQ